MNETSSILYSFENIYGDVETVKHLSGTISTVLTGRYITLELGGNDEGEALSVPILEGYKVPYISDVTDEIGTEHYVCYEEERKEKLIMTETVYVAQVNVLQDSTQNSVEVFNTYAKAVVFIIEAMTESRDVWGESEITQFINENNWTDYNDYEVSISEKHLL